MTEVASIYGQAMYDLARDEGQSQAILEQLTALRSSLQDQPDFIRLLCAPNI